MSTDSVSATTTIGAPAERVFEVLADPSTHEAIDGTGWVRESRDGAPIKEVDQVFRMAMYHDNHPDGHYQMANAVRAFDPPRAIAWEPGQDPPAGGPPQFGGWTWRYDLDPVSATETAVTLTYDWSAVGPDLREHIQFPPFSPDHLTNSLGHLADLATS